MFICEDQDADERSIDGADGLDSGDGPSSEHANLHEELCSTFLSSVHGYSRSMLLTAKRQHILTMWQ